MFATPPGSKTRAAGSPVSGDRRTKTARLKEPQLFEISPNAVTSPAVVRAAAGAQQAGAVNGGAKDDGPLNGDICNNVAPDGKPCWMVFQAFHGSGRLVDSLLLSLGC